MEKQVKNIDGFGKHTLTEHAQFLYQVWFGLHGRKAQEDTDD